MNRRRQLLVIYLFAIVTVALPGQVAPRNSASPQAIVLPLRLVAGQPATLAVIGVDGHLLPGVSVDLAGGGTIKTDASGRAFFNAPASPGAFLAKVTGEKIFAAAPVIAAVPADKPSLTQSPPVVSLHDHFAIRGQGFESAADANHVQLDGQPALVLASSPLSLVILPGPKTASGLVDLTVDVAGAQTISQLTLVAFEFDSGEKPIARGKKVKLRVLVRGSRQPLQLEIRNLSPLVVWFPKGDTHVLRTTGGVANAAVFDAQGLAAGDFSLSAKLVPVVSEPLDLEAARQLLSAAEPLATGKAKRTIGEWIGRLERHPKDASKVEKELDKFLMNSPKEELGFFLESARDSLRGL